MKKTILIIFAALALAACQTTGGTAKSAQDIAARVCPPLQGVLALLPVTQGISPETLAKISEAFDDLRRLGETDLRLKYGATKE